MLVLACLSIPQRPYSKFPILLPLHAAWQEEAEQLQKQLEKAEAEQARLQEALAAREAEQQQLEVATTKAREAEGEQLTQAKAALAAAAEEVARLQAELAARDRAHGERCDALQGQLAAATEEAAQARQELAAREELYEGRFQQVEGRLAAAAQAEGALQAAAAEAARLQQELVTREARYESRLRAMEAGQQLITKRLLVLEGDEEACGWVGGVGGGGGQWGWHLAPCVLAKCCWSWTSPSMHAAADPCLLAACLTAHHLRAPHTVLPARCMHRAPMAPPPALPAWPRPPQVAVHGRRAVAAAQPGGQRLACAAAAGRPAAGGCAGPGRRRVPRALPVNYSKLAPRLQA